MDDELQLLKEQYQVFLDHPEHQRVYADQVRAIREGEAQRLVVNVNDLRSFNPDLTRRLMRAPIDHTRALQEALLEKVNLEATNDKMADVTEVHVGFEGSFGRQLVSPRGLKSSMICSLVAVEGIVTKVSLVRPKVMKSVHYCPKTGQMHQREYRDATSLSGLPTGSVYPTKDEQGNALETEFGLSQYKDHQSIVVQEMPERSPLGQLPRSVDVVLDHDLVDKVKPGDRVRVVGIFRALAAAFGGSASGVFKTVVLASHVQPLGNDCDSDVTMTPDDVMAIKALAKREDCVEVLTRSLAPSIYGHEFIKKALLLQLLGGAEKTLDNGTHLRGDVNMLLIGDPSTAKSQMLRFVLSIAPLAVNTTGRGSSGVGLTAAVTTDSETGERRLEAGAMVLADRGIVCIDEFDKMSEIDRVAMHEVMEQQTVTIAKAGIQASLNARCSVIAAANPVYGQYDKSKKPQQNIGMPDSLLSRFDLLFIVLDEVNPEHDRRISSHVLRMHRYQRPGREGVPLSMQITSLADLDNEAGAEDETKKAEVWQRHDPLLHSALAPQDGSAPPDLLTLGFVKKYLAYAKRRAHPTLTEEAREELAVAFATLRNKQDTKTMPVTTRSLETMIRLSTAHAKARLSARVEASDCRSALNLMRFALYHDAEPVTAKGPTISSGSRKRRFGGPADSDSDSSDDESSSAAAAAKRAKKRAAGDEDVDMAALQEAEEAELPQGTEDERRRLFSDSVSRALRSRDGVSEGDLLVAVNALASQSLQPFSPGEAKDLLAALAQKNRIMLSQGCIYGV